ncbi:MAG: hypothetical protein GY755_21210 [Chloroflexi bacterium]|nr:hypothetical protein [Chloroflexota bacterium]
MDKDALKKGAWIVHRQHGVGQIEGTEEKKIGNDVHRYFRVKVREGVYWLPVKNIPDYVRVVSSENQFQSVLKIIRQAPEEMAENYKERERDVAEKLENSTLEVKGELIRDLQARRMTEGMKLSALNERQLDALRMQFLREMVVVLDINMEEAEEKLDKALRKSVSKLAAE